jgi:2-dehydro-3-deoxy-D-gluconate 5-dehydrogenase
VAPDPRHQPDQRLPLLPGGLPGHAPRRRRQDRQHRLDDVDLRHSFNAPYAATKGGIVQLTKALATAWAKDNIQVNAVLPGWIDTALTRRGRADIPGLEERVTARTPAGRWGTPDDFAGIAAFLAGPGSDFVTGTAIPVDGGYAVQG